MTEKCHASIDFFGPPTRLLPVAIDFSLIASARAVHWPNGACDQAVGTQPMLHCGIDAAHTRLCLDPATPPGDYTAVLDLADGRQHEITVSVQQQPRSRITPNELRFTGSPGDAVSARLLLENRGNIAISVNDTLITGVFDDNGIETAFASTYRMKTEDLNKIASNFFERLRGAHGGLLRLQVIEGAGETRPSDCRVLTINTKLSSKLHRGHGYHGVLQIGENNIAVHLQITAADSSSNQKGVAL